MTVEYNKCISAFYLEGLSQPGLEKFYRGLKVESNQKRESNKIDLKLSSNLKIDDKFLSIKQRKHSI